MHEKTIFALSSGSLPSGVAIIRVSGPAVADTAEKILGCLPPPRKATFSRFRHPSTGDLLDEGLSIYFPGPNSFTGEDVLELQGHGGKASVEAILTALASIEGLRVAEAGEFSRRAFENNRMDLTELEGLSDLIAAQTEGQRRQALSQSQGVLRALYEGWRSDIIQARALIEAELDFADEDDVPGSVSDQVWSGVLTLINQISDHLDDGRRGELIREGFSIALLGPPNAGKSSLLNALARRDVAIVTPQAGTTRDTIEISMRIGEHLVVITDTAGLRQTDDEIEREGIKRAVQAARHADLVVWLSPSDAPADLPVKLREIPNEQLLTIGTKADLATSQCEIVVSTVYTNGLDVFLRELEDRIDKRLGHGESAALSRQRHRFALNECSNCLRLSIQSKLDLELRSEHLRQAGDHLGRLTGRIDVEDLLDVIFSEFCVGK
ncbi:tRNA uridine-5-carboxymethylaminomethyl(34) synthesis GTPase MnmE [Pseudahrensia aquimaris]|uniref:tRNA modification GTPase MnmE n=1 Tax=Pseudahrensia aquimaris TaxID=744461 RepID=A0ABW3FE17_9HYPH